jgi:hypothetical protein
MNITKLLRWLSALLTLILAFTITQFLILSYPPWWYFTQDSTTEAICRDIRRGDAKKAVSSRIDDNSYQHGEAETRNILQFWTAAGVCSVTFDPSTEEVVSSEYAENPDQMIGIK